MWLAGLYLSKKKIRPKLRDIKLNQKAPIVSWFSGDWR
jgi:hypothetical protein